MDKKKAAEILEWYLEHENLSEEEKQAFQMAIDALKDEPRIDDYDTEEIYENCTVQIWENTKTGDVSIGWWQNGGVNNGTE